jgi:hypothetical protein
VAAPAGLHLWGVVGPLVLPVNKGGTCFTARGRGACAGAKLPDLVTSGVENPILIAREQVNATAP